MKLIRLGNIFSGHRAQCPVVDDLGEKLRVYYSDRDNEGHSFISYLECEPLPPFKILYDHLAPILPPGKPGTFDEHGQMPTCILEVNGRKLLYYIGWSRSIGVPYQNAIGVAMVSGNWFKKLFEGPVLGRSASEPYFTGTALVSKIRKGGYSANYLSCIGWTKDKNPLYEIKRATSDDGISWSTGVTTIELRENEGGICSAAILNNNMLFCVRGRENFRDGMESYSIHYATFENERWTRRGRALDCGNDNGAWDFAMQCYPYIITPRAAGGRSFCFYNGNGFGLTGIGVLEVLQQ